MQNDPLLRLPSVLTVTSVANKKEPWTGGRVALSKCCTTSTATGILPVLGLAILGKCRSALVVPNWLPLWQDLNFRSTWPMLPVSRPHQNLAARQHRGAG